MTDAVNGDDLPRSGPPSPCARRCLLDPTQSLCLGCGRTLAEIAAWPGATAAAQRAIVAAAVQRRRRPADNLAPASARR